MSPGYEAFFGLVERPFSLTPDPRYFFESRSHGSAIDTITDGLGRRDQLLLTTGDLGVGKTVLCRTLIGRLRSRVPVSYIANPLLTPSGLFRLLLEDFGALSGEQMRGDRPSGAAPSELRDLLLSFLDRRHTSGDGAVVVVDEAQTLPVSVVEHLLSVAALEPNRDQRLQIVLVGQPLRGEPGAMGFRALNDRVTTTTRLMPLGRDECSAYVAHRLGIAGAAATALFTSSAVDMLYALSGGVPRLINLLAERALQEAATQRTHKIGAGMVDAAASALELLRGAPRRFRWFTRRVS